MKTNQHNQHIIAIGASAGGMDALEVFFRNTPLDGVSYVIVQHLSGDHKSHLAELLSRHSKLEVREATNNMEVESNKVYVIPNREFMTIENGRLQLQKKLKKDSPHKTINTFFQSLASDRGDKAIGIILSGSGSDGVDGIEAIKQVGGLVLVQEPSSALNHEMPEAAIASQMVDIVLRPDAMPKAIADYVSNVPWGFPVLPNGPGKDHLNLILEYLKDHYPVDFSEYKPSTLSRRVERRMAANHVNTTEDYLNFMKENPEELEVLAHHFLISVTAFFRDKEVFALLEKKVIPDILSQRAEGFKAWVAGCATGEEAYSLAILVKEYLDENHLQIPVRIFATDIDDHALSLAGKGLYGIEELKNVSPARLKRFFVRKEDKFQVKQEIREMLIFAHHDLVKNAPYCQMDLISCRNVLIYMKPPLQKKVLSMLHFGLKTNGYLLIGQNENVESMGPSFSEFSKKWRVFQKTNIKRSPHLESFIPQLARERILTSTDHLAPKSQQIPGLTADHVNELLLDEFGYSGVCTDKDLNVVRTYGDVSWFLLAKILTFNLRDLLPDTLAVAVGATAKKALKLNQKVSMQRIPITIRDRSAWVDLVVKPFSSRSGERFMLVLFREQIELTDGEGTSAEVFNLSLHSRKWYEEMEEELMESRAQLAEAYAKIDAAETNVQSFNEELLSANEEMQSANEEMQSVNEELQTINNERLQKIQALSELNDDLNNYFKSNLNGQIFVNDQMILKKFTPRTAEYLNLIDSDIGRPITRLSTNFRFDTLIGDIRKVIEEGGVVTREMQSENGPWFQVMVMPYVHEEGNRHDGAIISFTDITVLKNAQEELALSNQSLLRINDDLTNFVYSASHDLSGPIFNIEITIGMISENLTDPGPTVKRLLDILKNSVVNFRMVIKELSDVAKIEGEMIREPDPISLKKLLEEVRLSILDKIVESDTVIKTRFDVKDIRFSKKNMRSIFYNLISNAIKFRSPDRPPLIYLKTKDVLNFVRLSFTDNGIGMEKDKVDKIFGMYHRLTDREGSGIGLYLVRKIIDASGGKVEVESEPGEGTTFHLYFKK